MQTATSMSRKGTFCLIELSLGQLQLYGEAATLKSGLKQARDNPKLRQDILDWVKETMGL